MFPLKLSTRGPLIIQGMSSYSHMSVSSLSLPLPSFLLQSKIKLNEQHFWGKRFTKTNFSTVGLGSAMTESEIEPTSKLTKDTASSLVVKLTNEERTTLLNTLQQFESEQQKAEFKG